MGEIEYPLQVDYCGVCGLPPEYCEFGPQVDKCREWLKDRLPDLYVELVGALEGLEVSEDGKEEKKRQTRGGKGVKAVKKKAAAEKLVTISKETRSKKKYVTIVKGMSTFDIDPKKAAKVFSNKFACGTSVDTNIDEIVIQGDVGDDLLDFIPEKWPEIDEDNIEDKT